MNDAELRKLDAWICEHVMGCEPWPEQVFNERAFKAPIVPPGTKPMPCSAPNYTTNVEFSFLVLKKCIEECGWDGLIMGQTADGGYFIGHNGISSESNSIELAICLCAKKLFAK